jgi:hypothetical protein
MLAGTRHRTHLDGTGQSFPSLPCVAFLSDGCKLKAPPMRTTHTPPPSLCGTRWIRRFLVS